MLDLIIDLMTCINALGQNNAPQEKKRKLKDAIESAQAIENRLQRELKLLENANLEPR
jgi:hypothetical protein